MLDWIQYARELQLTRPLIGIAMKFGLLIPHSGELATHAKTSLLTNAPAGAEFVFLDVISSCVTDLDAYRISQAH